MTKYGRVTSDVQTTDPDSKFFLEVLEGILSEGGNHYTHNIVFYMPFVNV